jgi:formyltetrahydrofolate-dependent phosphoribosylglycinamide formyltransferase
MRRIAVLASGGGTNLQALIDHFHTGGNSVATVALVVSDRENAGALARARSAGIPSRVIAVKGRNVDDIASDTLAAFTEHTIDVVALAGYLRLIPDAIVRRYRGRIVNVHPALLPAFGGPGMYGMHVHRAVIESGCTVTGVTVHEVDERYDEGRAIVQWPVPVLRGDTAESLAARVLRVEHAVYPLAVEAIARRVPAGGADASAGPASTVSRAGLRGDDPAAFEWSTGDGIAAQVRRLLDIEGDTT